MTESFSLNQAAKILGVSRSLVKRAVDKGLLRSTKEPFKSNLNNAGDQASLTLVDADDVRAAARGDIDLSVLTKVRVPEKREVPKTPEEALELMTNIMQSLEQLQLMVGAVIERLDAAPPPVRLPKQPKGTTTYEPH